MANQLRSAALAVGVWIASGLVAGFALYLANQREVGGEAFVFVFAGLAFGVIGGCVFALLLLASRTGAVAGGPVLGLASAGLLIVLSALWHLLQGGASMAHYDLFYNAAELVAGGIIGGLLSALGRKGA